MIEVMEGVGETFSMVASSKNIHSRIEAPGHQAVCADIGMIKTVIRSLVSNAIKFNSKDSKILTKLEDMDGMLIVSIEDSGCSIGKESQKKLLHIDTHFSTLGTNSEEDLGLGLPLYRDFIVKNRGKL